MKRSRFFALILCAVMLISALPMTASAADAITEVSTFAQFKSALQDNAGARVKLTADITITTAEAGGRLHEDDEWEQAFGIVVGEGCYTIELNGHKIEYNYTRSGNNDGSPLVTANTRALTINGPGSIVGGYSGIEHNSDGILTINGGAIRGVMAYGLRLTKGVAVINGGEVTGNFGGVEHEDGIIVNNGGTVGRIRDPQDFSRVRCYGIIDENGAFTGEATLENTVLVMDDLTITPLSGITVRRGGGLIVNGSFVNNGEFTHESGMKSLDGNALVTAGEHSSYVYITQDVTFKTLTIEEHAQIYITNGATVTVTGAYVNVGGGVTAKNGSLKMLGNIDHRGHSEGVPELAALEGGGQPGAGERDFEPAYGAANHLYEIGLFKGVGTNPDGSPHFALERAPNRVEALVMLIRLLGKEAEALSGDWTHPFTDVPGWADEYVGYAYEKKLTNGVSATSFGTGDATAQMYLTFVLRSLGYSDAAGGQFTWDKPEALAESVGILPPGVDMKDFLRADVTLISEAALSAKLKDSGVTLLDKLIADGAVKAD